MHIAASPASAARGRRAAGLLPTLVIALCAAVAGACASGGGGGGAAAVVPAAPAIVFADSEERAAHEHAGRLRRHILESMAWTEMGSDSCRPGDFRSVRDTTTEKMEMFADSVRRLERIVISMGAEDTIDNPAGHDLLRTVISWEAGVGRPLWDVLPGETRRREAIAAGLTGSYANPQTGKCEAINVLEDTVHAVIPPMTSFVPPTLGKSVVAVHVGDSGLAQARERFYGARGAADPNALFTYLRVSALVVWRDYGLVVVNRPAEARGILSLPQSGGGATYLFHRVGGEWRLLSIVRTWV